MLLDRLGSPDAQLVDSLAGIAHDGDVARNGQDVLRVYRAIERAAILLKASTRPPNLIVTAGLILTTDLPGYTCG